MTIVTINFANTPLTIDCKLKNKTIKNIRDEIAEYLNLQLKANK